jgi:hypothetical protein
MLLMVLFFFSPCPFPQSTLEKLWFCGGGVFSPHLFAYTWVRQQWTGSWVHLTGGFLVLVFFSLPLSLSPSSLSLNLFVLLWKRLKCQKLSSHEISPGAGDVVYHQLL